MKSPRSRDRTGLKTPIWGGPLGGHRALSANFITVNQNFSDHGRGWQKTENPVVTKQKIAQRHPATLGDQLS
jgi:hypothetical protein